jgi:hypothetical protein
MIIRESGTPPPVYIFDLDSTLANIDHRLPILSDASLPVADRWSMFYQQCDHDTPIRATLQTLHFLLYIGCNVWVWTGRSAEVETQTREWLQRHCSFFEACCETGEMELRMRAADDYRPGHELKESWLNSLSREDRARIAAVYDDRPDEVAMYRRHGVQCFQVAEGDIEALREQTEDEIVAERWKNAMKQRICPGMPIIYIAKTPFSDVGDPASTDHERRLAERLAEDDECPDVGFASQVRFIRPRVEAGSDVLVA